VGAQDFLLPPVLGVVLAMRAGPCTSLMLSKCWLVVRQVTGKLIGRREGRVSLVPLRTIHAACVILVGHLTPVLSSFLICKLETSTPTT